MCSRVVRIPLERPDDAGWKDLVDLAREGAAFANGLIASWWAGEHGYMLPEGRTAFKDFKGRLSGDVRVSIQSEAFAAWRKVKARVMRRDQRLPAFAADRSLSVRGRYSAGNGGIRWRLDGKEHVVDLLLVGKDHGGWRTYRVWDGAVRKDRYLATLLAKITSGVYRCGKLTLLIDQRRRKLYALASYERPLPAVGSAERSATLGPLEEDGSFLLRSQRSTRDFTRELWEIRSKKEQFAGIVRRLRRSIGRGPDWRRAYRKKLPATYEAWAHGKLHQLSAAIVGWLRDQGVGSLTIAALGDGDWPASQFVMMLEYKCRDAGIATTRDVDLGVESTNRAERSVVKKAGNRLSRARRALKEVGEVMGGQP